VTATEPPIGEQNTAPDF